MQTVSFQQDDFDVLAVPVLSDNFAYLVCHAGEAVLVDAGEAQPILHTLAARKLRLQKILITHTHPDHIGGCRAIHDRLGVQSVSPSVESCEFDVLGTPCQSISAPGHMAIHKIYYFAVLGMLFTGDALINGACGRLLGGTAEQLFCSLRHICTLPDETRIFGGHDYLVDNMEFALSIEPDNPDMHARLSRYRTDPAAAIFSTLGEEKKTNPFLRVDTAAAFAALRARKDVF